MNNNLCKNILPKVKQFDPLIFYYRGYSEVSRKKKKKNPFREAFGRVKDLRSVLPGIPLLALTATVQSNERAKLIKASGMVQPIIVDVSPNKENIMFNAIFVPDEKEEVTHLKWIADMVAVKGKETPQTIVFCNTFNDIANILSYLLLVLKEKAFTEDSNGKKKALLGVYHAKSWDSQKVSIEDDFKSDGIQRVVIATCALGMGINFPQVRSTSKHCGSNATSWSWWTGWQPSTLCGIFYETTAFKMWKGGKVCCEIRGMPTTGLV